MPVVSFLSNRVDTFQRSLELKLKTYRKLFNVFNLKLHADSIDFGPVESQVMVFVIRRCPFGCFDDVSAMPELNSTMT